MKRTLFLLLSFCFFQQATATPHFIENKGQVKDQQGACRSDIDFVLKEKGFRLFVGKGMLIWQFQNNGNGRVAYNRMEARLKGFNPTAKLLTAKPLLTQYHYYLPGCGQDGAHASTFDKITYRDIYPGIDWEIYINQNGKVEYDFVLHPGADLNQIKMEIKGADKVTLPGNGSLLAVCALGEVRQALPVAFDSKGNSVACRYHLDDNVLSFNAAAPANEKWRIDPVLEWGTYLGGEENDQTSGVILNVNKQPLIYGTTGSATDIATTGAYQDTLTAGALSTDAFLAQFNTAGQLVWATYLGGDGFDVISAADADSYGNIFIAGATGSLNMATPGAFQTANNNINTPFIARLNSSGHRIWYSYFGGGGEAWAIAAGPDSSIYITGRIDTAGMATPGAHQEAMAGVSDVFLLKMDWNGNRLWSTYYGGGNSDACYDMSLDEAGNVYLAGSTSSTSNISTPGSFQTAIGVYSDGFLAKFTPAGNRVWGTYLGGAGADAVYSVLIKDNHLYALLQSNSDGLATSGVHQVTRGGGYDYLLASFDTAGNRNWSTYYGGSGSEYFLTGKKRIDTIGNDLLITVITASPDGMTTPGALMPVAPNTYQCAALARFTNNGQLVWGTYLGGNVRDPSAFLAVADSGIIYVGGHTVSNAGIATPGTHQTVHNDGGSLGFDAYLIRLKEDIGTGVAPLQGPTAHGFFTVQPNPARQTTLLSGSAPAQAFPIQITCTDVSGKALWQSSLKSNAGLPQSLDFSRQPAGIYFIRIKGNGVSESLKVVKE